MLLRPVVLDLDTEVFGKTQNIPNYFANDKLCWKAQFQYIYGSAYPLICTVSTLPRMVIKISAIY